MCHPDVISHNQNAHKELAHLEKRVYTLSEILAVCLVDLMLTDLELCLAENDRQHQGKR